jgi:hypothetical protein
LFAADKEFVGTGLERGDALTKDIAHMTEHWSMAAPSATEDGPGHTYAKYVPFLKKGKQLYVFKLSS